MGIAPQPYSANLDRLDGTAAQQRTAIAAAGTTVANIFEERQQVEGAVITYPSTGTLSSNGYTQEQIDTFSSGWQIHTINSAQTTNPGVGRPYSVMEFGWNFNGSVHNEGRWWFDFENAYQPGPGQPHFGEINLNARCRDNFIHRHIAILVGSDSEETLKSGSGILFSFANFYYQTTDAVRWLQHEDATDTTSIGKSTGSILSLLTNDLTVYQNGSFCAAVSPTRSQFTQKVVVTDSANHTTEIYGDASGSIIQSLFGKPLRINPLGNNLIVGSALRVDPTGRGITLGSDTTGTILDANNDFVFRQNSTTGGLYFDFAASAGIVFRRNTDFATAASINQSGNATFAGVVSGTINTTPITKSALLALTPAAAAGEYRITNSSPAQRRAYPDGTNWRYSDDSTIVT